MFFKQVVKWSRQTSDSQKGFYCCISYFRPLCSVLVIVPGLILLKGHFSLTHMFAWLLACPLFIALFIVCHCSSLLPNILVLVSNRSVPAVAAKICMVLPFKALCVAETQLHRHCNLDAHSLPPPPHLPPTPLLPRSRPFPLTPPADFLEPHISPSSVFLFLSSPQPDSPSGQVPPGGPRGWHSGAGVPCFRKAQAHHPVVASR